MATPTHAGRTAEIESKGADTTLVHAKGVDRASSSNGEGGNGVAHFVGEDEENGGVRVSRRKQWFGYVKTKQFWLVLVFGYVWKLFMMLFVEVFVMGDTD
jgi:hypothetical protein